MKTIQKQRLTTIAMVQGGETKHPVVIINGNRMRWIGFGWINEGAASAKDKKTLPTAVDTPK